MDLSPFPSSIGQDLNSQPSDNISKYKTMILFEFVNILATLYLVQIVFYKNVGLTKKRIFLKFRVEIHKSSQGRFLRFS